MRRAGKRFARIVLPNSISGILTGVILQVSRAAGETAPIMFTGAVFYKAIAEGNLFAYNILEQCMGTIPTSFYNFNTGARCYRGNSVRDCNSACCHCFTRQRRINCAKGFISELERKW